MSLKFVVIFNEKSRTRAMPVVRVVAARQAVGPVVQALRFVANLQRRSFSRWQSTVPLALFFPFFRFKGASSTVKTRSS